MSVYVDDARLPYRQMRMCHMVADTSDELHAMADRIGVARRWCQAPGTYREHYDICLAKRALAVKHGALEITRRSLGAMLRRRRGVENGGAMQERDHNSVTGHATPR